MIYFRAEAIEQICKQLNRLIPIIKVVDLNINEAVEREIALVKIKVKDEEKSDILRIAEATNAKIIDITDKIYILQAIGDEKQIQALVEMVRPYSVREFVRSGKVAISRTGDFSNIKNA